MGVNEGGVISNNQHNKHSPDKTIFVDVDGTLFVNGVFNENLGLWIRRKKIEGYSLTLWSARGEGYAIGAARLSGLFDVFDHIIGKPGYIVDDKGWSWCRYVQSIPLSTFK